MTGYLSWPSGRQLIGWAWDPERPERRLRVELSIDGVPYRTKTAHHFRADLATAGVGDGRYAFSFDLPRQVFDGKQHSLAVITDGEHLHDSPLIFQSRYTGAFTGTIEHGRVEGTLWDASRGQLVKVRADLYNGDTGECIASAYTEQGKFSILLPAGFDPRTVGVYELRAFGSAVVVRAAPVSGQADGELLNRMRRALETSPEELQQFELRFAPLLLRSASSGLHLQRLEPAEVIESAALPATAAAPAFVPVDPAFEPRLVESIEPVVDIVMPVYAGVSETAAAIDSVLSAPVRTAYELIVVLDNPADEAMSRLLEGYGDRITLIRNATNLGFVASVNRGMALHPQRDVLLLNSDTLAPAADWLDRLRDAAYRDAYTGTVTPFSNNATICSAPRICHDNPFDEDLDTACRALFAGRELEIPTAVGFCMYIRRECLALTGPFDEATFGAGYGEENDFCMRASRLGWRHVLAADVYVRHRGRVSFQVADPKAVRQREAAARLSAKHPGYDRLIADFLARDPLLPLRRELEVARWEQGGETVCVATNALPGGTERHVHEQLDGGAVLLRYRNGGEISLEAAGSKTGNLRYELPREREELRKALDRLGVRRLHVHQIVQAPLDLFALGIPYDVTVHDYAWICPQVTLQDATGDYCGEPAVAVCEHCLGKLGPHKDWGSLYGRSRSVREMRRQNAAVLAGAGTVYFPSHDIAERIARYAPMAHMVVRPHDAVTGAAALRAWKPFAGERVRVAYIGTLGHSKGYKRLLECALDARRRELQMDFVVIGGTADDDPLLDAGVHVTGPYEEHELRELLARHMPHVAFFPGVLPESYSYTLSAAFEAGVWPVAFDLGAIAERVRRAGFGRLLALGMGVMEVNDCLLAEARGGP